MIRHHVASMLAVFTGRRQAMRVASACFGALLLAAPLVAADPVVTLRVVDQGGQDIAGATMKLLGGTGQVASGTSVSVAEGTYTARMYVFGGHLIRDETGIVIAAGTTDVTIEWKTRTVTLGVVDQFGVDLAKVHSLQLYPTGITVPQGGQVTMPINDSSVYSGLSGLIGNDGYALVIAVFNGNLLRYGWDNRIFLDESSTEVVEEWKTRTVTLGVVDQFGADLAKVHSLQLYPTGITVPLGGQVTLPINDPAVYPHVSGTVGLDGYALVIAVFNGNLLRYGWDDRVFLNESSTEVVEEWITQTVTLGVEDQFGADLPNVHSLQMYPTGITVGQGGQVTLPINDPAVYPHVSGTVGLDGYALVIAVFNGNLLRYGWDNRVFLNQSTTEVVEEWITQTVTLGVEDQFGVDLPSVHTLQMYPTGITVGQGGQVTLPINDPAVYPNVSGTIGNDGYVLVIHLFNGLLVRYSWDDRTFMNQTTTEVTQEWITISGPLHVVDAGNQPLDGSTYNIPGITPGPTPSGDTITLPITDNVTYSGISGPWANGYYIVVDPSTAGSMGFAFEVLPNASLLPASFTIDATTFGLRFILNEAPIANAGDNLTILSSEQSVTTVAGSGSDSDDDAMTYRWLENGTEVQAGSVTASGDAPLDLSLLGALSLGNHTFDLEVSDGQETSTDSMILSVDNSPPVIAVGGDITAEVGDDITLTGGATDFDGDTLSYSWAEGATVLASGSFASIAGGDPVDVPLHTITGGLSLGAHSLTLTVDDGANPSVSASVAVSIVDTQAPTMAPVSDTGLLWPPNHQLVTVTVALNANDNGGGALSFSAVVSSTENPDKDGDGNTIPDWTEPTFDTQAGTMTVLLRAERSGKGTGRVYTVTITATDGSGNSSDSTIQVVCPHDRRKK